MTDAEQRGEGEADTDDEYALAPLEAQPDRVDLSVPPGGLPELVETPEEPERFQFTLSELLWLVAAASLLFSMVSSIARVLPGGMTAANFAGLMGLGALVCMVILALLPPGRKIVTVAWWTLVGLYLMACIVALIVRD